MNKLLEAINKIRAANKAVKDPNVVTMVSAKTPTPSAVVEGTNVGVMGVVALSVVSWLSVKYPSFMTEEVKGAVVVLLTAGLSLASKWVRKWLENRKVTAS